MGKSSMGKVRLSTFNCENLFSRPKVLNYADNEDARKPLNRLVKLDTLLARRTYSPRDKRRILELLAQLRPYIDLNELRGKLVGRQKLNGKLRDTIKANGRADWVGGIVLKRDTLPSEAQHNTAEVIRAIDADIQCVIEVEDRLTLERFNDALLKGPRAYPYNILIDGNDPRGIDVGLLSRFPFAAVNTHVFDTPSKASKSRIFSRDCLEVELTLSPTLPLFVLVNHFKSQGYGIPASCNARRKAQAKRVAAILRGYDLKKDFVVVAGDFNAEPQSATLAALLRTKNLTDVLAKQFADPRERWTYRDKSQLDYLLVSKPLADAMTDAGIERRGLFEAGKLTKNLPSGQVRAFPSITSDSNDASDHAAVWAEFWI